MKPLARWRASFDGRGPGVRELGREGEADAGIAAIRVKLERRHRDAFEQRVGQFSTEEAGHLLEQGGLNAQVTRGNGLGFGRQQGRLRAPARCAATAMLGRSHWTNGSRQAARGPLGSRGGARKRHIGRVSSTEPPCRRPRAGGGRPVRLDFSEGAERARSGERQRGATRDTVLHSPHGTPPAAQVKRDPARTRSTAPRPSQRPTRPSRPRLTEAVADLPDTGLPGG